MRTNIIGPLRSALKWEISLMAMDIILEECGIARLLTALRI